MKKFMIEVPHGATKADCEHAINAFKESGSEFLTEADWGCMDGVHKAWFMVDVNDRSEALNYVPSSYKDKSTVVELMKLASEEEMASDKYHSA